jgi:subtilisin-like proprotein convertase family protein
MNSDSNSIHQTRLILPDRLTSHRTGLALALFLLTVLIPLFLLPPFPAHAQDPVPLNTVGDWFSLGQDSAYSMAWGDVDGDGDLDLAIGNDKRPNQLYLNVGGNLNLVWTAATTHTTTSVAWGDVDGDGDLDLAVGNDGQPNQLYLNQGLVVPGAVSMTLASWSPSEAHGTTSVAWGDVDGDGDLDLAAGNSGSANKVYLNQNGVLQTAADNPWSSNEMDNTTSVVWGDVDGDGDLDLAVGNSWQPNRLYLNQGLDVTGALSMTLASWSPSEAHGTTSVAWGDGDGDGDLDLVVGNDGQPNQLYLNWGGRLENSATWTSSETDSTTSVAWGDVDSDGDLDLAVGNLWPQPNRLYLNQGRALQIDEAAWSSSEAHDTRSVAWGDVDGDGDLDLVAGSKGDQVNRLYLNQGSALQTNAAWSSTETEVENAEVAWGDVDGDGDLDLAVGNTDGNRLYLNQGGRLENNATQIGEAGGGASLAWGDVDGDSDLDLATASWGELTRLYMNQGIDATGALSMTLAWSSAAYPTWSVAWGDVDGDGDLDLAVGNDERPNRLYLNQGGALQQTAVWTSTEADSTASVAWGDVDGDGDLDLAVGNGGWHSLESNRLYLNDGGALQTSAAWSSSEEDKTYAVAWGDVDGDGDLDLAVGNFRQPNRLYLNQGGALQTNAAWSSRWIYETESLAWGDVDGDGDLDLAVASWNEANRLHLNQGGVLGTTTAWSSSEADTTYGVAWGDVDGDGDLDLAASGDQPSRLYLNRRQGGQALSNNLPAIGAGRPYSSTADFYAQSGILASPTIPLTYTLFDPEGDPVGRLATLYSLNGGGQWFPAVATTDTITTNLRTGRLAHYGDQSGPQSIPDNTGSPLNASILVTDSLDLAHVAVWLIITHTNNRDLAVTLQSPAGTQVPLFSSDSLTGSNLIGTVFDDQAATPIISGTAPFTGTYRPEGNLAAFQGQSSSGTWTLLITDTMANGYTGTLAAWGMRIRTAPVAHVYNWDIFASGFFGQSDNVVMRLVAYPQAASPAISGTYRYTNTVAGPFQRPYASATSFPFRVRGTQVRVYSETVHISNTVENAMVYRLPADQPTGGFPLADSSGTPFRTDQHGYLQGRGEIGLGDQLFAMAPVYTAPDYGGALVFDGVADYVDAGSQITLANSSFTVAFWAKRDGINDYDFVVGQGPENTNQGLHIGFRNNNAFTCAFYYSSLDK